MNTATTLPTSPSTARLHLDAHRSSARTVDGAWWPRSRNVEAEVTQLVIGAQAELGQIDRVLLNVTEWPDHPRKLEANGQVIRLGFFSSAAHLATLVRRNGDDVVLLLVPPTASDADAAAAIARAVDSADRSRPVDMLGA
jgi:hypothetical protein